MTAAVGAPPLTFTAQQAVVGLYLVNDFRRAPQPPSEGWFARHGLLTGLLSTSRRSARRLARLDGCIACDRELARRLTLGVLGRERGLGKPAPDGMDAALRELARALPSVAHQYALLERIYGIVGRPS